MKSRVIIMDEQGAPSVLRQDTVELDAPGPGEVRLRQTAMGLNYMDVYQRSGYYPLDLPSGLGMEAAGVIEAVGNGVDDFKEGDRAAYGGGPPGGYAEYRNLPASRLVKIPDAVTDEQAAATMLKGMTVEYLLNRTDQIKAGEAVLFWAAAGGVGAEGAAAALPEARLGRARRRGNLGEPVGRRARSVERGGRQGLRYRGDRHHQPARDHCRLGPGQRRGDSSRDRLAVAPDHGDL